MTKRPTTPGSMAKLALVIALMICRVALAHGSRNNAAFVTTSIRHDGKSDNSNHQPRPFSMNPLRMGWLDSVSGFLNRREGDFMKLDKTDKGAFGPGPLLLLYKVPDGITNDEIQDMISDGAPTAFQKQVVITRIRSDGDELMNMPVTNAFDAILNTDKTKSSPPEPSIGTINAPSPTTMNPVLFFSGFRNDEMLATYNILGQEIYEETAGSSSPACAMAVPNAMEKPLRQVLEEISGDHEEAMEMG